MARGTASIEMSIAAQIGGIREEAKPNAHASDQIVQITVINRRHRLQKCEKLYINLNIVKVYVNTGQCLI